MEFVFSHAGRVIEKESTPDELGLEERDEIWAVEFKDLGSLQEAEEEEEALAKEAEEGGGVATPLAGGGGSKKKKKGGGGGGGSNTPVSSASIVVAGSPSLGTLVLGGGSGLSGEERIR